MDDGRFLVKMAGGVPVVAVPVELDITNAPGLEPALAEAADKGHGKFVVDMSRTRFCDCAGLHILLAAHKRARADGGGLVLVIGGTAVLRLFEITGAGSVVPCFASLEEALAARPSTGPATGGLTAQPRPATVTSRRPVRRRAVLAHPPPFPPPRTA